MARGGLWLCGLGFAVSLAACVTNHAELERKRNSAQAGSSQGGNLAAGGSRALHAGAAGAEASGGGHADDEARGASLLAIVNGVVDAPQIALCLAKVDAQSNAVPFGDPLSSAPIEYGHGVVFHDLPGADLARDTLQPFAIAGDLELIAGLDCAAAIALALSEETAKEPPLAGDQAGTAATSVDPPPVAGQVGTAGASVDPPPLGGQGGTAGTSVDPPSVGGQGGTAGTSVDPPPVGGQGGTSGAGAAAAFAGESANVEGGAAAQAGSGGASRVPAPLRSRLRVRGLPAIGAGTLNAGRSLLLAINGCMGGLTFGGKDAESYCGAGYSERAPTLSAMLVSLSRRVAFGRTGMQVLNASLANDQIDVHSVPPFPSQDAALIIASNVVEGQVAPRPASLNSTAFDWGSQRLYRLEVSSKGFAASTNGNQSFSDSWGNVLARSGLHALVDTRTYALVLSGPEASRKAVRQLWNAPVLTVVAVDPE